MRIKEFCMDNVAAKEKLENLLRHISADYEKNCGGDQWKAELR